MTYIFIVYIFENTITLIWYVKLTIFAASVADYNPIWVKAWLDKPSSHQWMKEVQRNLYQQEGVSLGLVQKSE
jgi:cytochrome b subunit of formate dehydrogenase